MKTYRQKHPYIAQIGYILRYKAATVHMDVQGQGLQTHLFVLRIL